jgi:predicted nucleic acid-binding protein
MKPRIYIETTVISYLAARPARDVVTLARQEMSRDFWLWAPSAYDLCCSSLTRDEVSKGDSSAASRRLVFADQCSTLPDDLRVAELAKKLMDVKAVPATEPEDAAHIAIATLVQVKYIVSWNFSHMVSPEAKRQLEKAIVSLGFTAPLLGTPEEIFEAEAL